MPKNPSDEEQNDERFDEEEDQEDEGWLCCDCGIPLYDGWDLCDDCDRIRWEQDRFGDEDSDSVRPL